MEDAEEEAVMWGLDAAGVIDKPPLEREDDVEEEGEREAVVVVAVPAAAPLLLP